MHQYMGERKLKIATLILTGFLASCGGGEDSDPVVDCNLSNLAASISDQTNSACGSSDGSVTIAAAGGGGDYSYRVGTGSFNSSNTISSLSTGSHEVTVKDNNDCETILTVSILSGVSYESSIKTIIDTNCATTGCHVAGTGRADFSTFNTVKSNAAGIKSRTQSGNMPKTGSITQEQKDLIACWVDDGVQNN
jgi:hypothetical protein